MGATALQTECAGLSGAPPLSRYSRRYTHAWWEARNRRAFECRLPHLARAAKPHEASTHARCFSAAFAWLDRWAFQRCCVQRPGVHSWLRRVVQRRPGKALSVYCLGLDPDLHLRWQACVQGGALEVSVCVVFSGPQDREPASKLVFLGKAADLKAYLESQELANRNGRGSDFAGANRCDTAPPDKAAGPTFPTPPQAGLTMVRAPRGTRISCTCRMPSRAPIVPLHGSLDQLHDL